MTDLHVRAILFDMDGTLVDSTAMVDQMWGEFAAANGADRQQVIDFAHGRPGRDTIAKFVAQSSETAEWMRTITDWEEERFNGVAEIPGARDLVAAVPEHRWAVVTSALSGPARRRLHAVGFPPASVLVGADNVTRGKPDPEGYRAAADALGVDPSECVVFEDTPAGLAAGRAAGCAVVGVGEKAVATLVVADLTQVSLETAGDVLRVAISPA